MKINVSAQQIVHFRKSGHVRLEEIPFPEEALAKNPNCERDLWRESQPLKRWILHTLAPIALELVGKKRLRLACDQRIKTPFPAGRIQDFFCFQGLACVCILSLDSAQNAFLDIFEPSNLTSKISSDALYLIAIGGETTVLINNGKDPLTFSTRNLGYVFGDALRSEFHPLLTQMH